MPFATLLAACIAVFASAVPAHAALVQYWYGVQPTGDSGTGIPVSVQGSSGFDGSPLVASSVKLFVDGVVVPRAAYTASAYSTSVYLRWVPSPALKDGSHTFRVEVSDTRAVLSAYSWTTRTAQPPTASWAAPAAGSTVYSGRPTILMSLADNTPDTTYSVTGQVRAGSAAGSIVATFGTTGLAAGQNSFVPVAEVAPGKYYLTATVKDAAGNALAIQGTAARTFSTVALPAMSALTSCDSCHASVRTAHPVSPAMDCGVCHPDKVGAHMQGTDYCEDCHWDGWHNSGACGPVTVRSACTKCHGASRPEIKQHTAVSVAPTHGGSCSGCHVTSLLTKHTVAATGSAYSSQCDICHASADARVGAAIAGGQTTCSACHDGHGDLAVLHTYAGMDASCQSASCHANTLPEAHAAFVGAGHRYPQYADSCSLCHANTDPRRIPADATAACTSCHGDLGAGHLAVHATTVGMTALSGTSLVCADCHDSNMMTEHARPTAKSASKGCAACHPDPRSTITTFNPATCVQAGCHATGGAQQMHGAYAAGHALPSPVPSCSGSDCHTGGSDLAAFHAEAATTTVTGRRTGCLVCHGASSVPASGACGSCHAGDLANFHGDLVAKHTAPVTCLDTCHSSRLDSEHAARGLTCGACHDSAVSAVRNAIDGGQTACSACHGANHPLTAAFCTGCHTTSRGTFAGATTYGATKHGSTSSSTRALTQYPGTSYAAGACANCHGSHSATTRASGNQLCFACHDAAGTTKPTTYSYQGSATYAASGHAAKTCGSCHAVHGANDASGSVVAVALTTAEPANCTGTTLQPGCHASSANAKHGTNVLAAFDAGAAASTHHDVFGTAAGRIACSNCHDPHADSGTSEYANPAAIGTRLQNASDRFRDANGRVYALIGAQHDGVGPAISSLTTSLVTPGDPTKLAFRWYTNENCAGYVDYGTTTAYGSTVSSIYSNYTFHYISSITLPLGTTWHYRIRVVDALGNTTTSQDYVYRSSYTYLTGGPTVSGGLNAAPVTVAWSTMGACDSWVDYGPTTSYGSTAGSSAYVSSHSVVITPPPGAYHLRVRSARDGDSYTSADIPFTVFPSGAAASTLTTVPSDGNMTGPKGVTFDWTQPNTWAAPFTYELHVWDPYSSPAYDYRSSWLTTNTATITLDGDHNYSWTVQAKDKDGMLYPVSATGTFYLYYYSGGSGSCPFLYTWDGNSYRFESDEFAAGKLGLNTSKGYRKPNPFDYHVTATEPVAKDGALEYKLVEERAETDYLDQVKLYTAEAPADREIWVERSQAEGAGMFTSLDAVIHTTERVLKPPAKVTHVNTGEDVTAKIAAEDGDYLMLNADRNVGYDYQTIELDLGDVKDAPQTKLVIDGRTCIPTSVAGRQRSLLFGPQVKFEVQAADGSWKAVPTTNTILPKPPEFERPFVLDLSKIWISDSRKVRFTYLYKTYLDAILLDTSKDVPVKLSELPLQSADLAPHGYDAKSSLNELYDFVYGAPASPPYYYLPGNYTKFGSVTPLLGGIDDKFAIFGGGDELTLRFAQPAPVPANTNRRFLFVSDGYYKDLKQTIDHTVDPLPFAAMSNFPYPATEHYPDDADHQAYRAEWNTRYEDGAAAPIEQPATLSSLVRSIDGLFYSLLAKVEAFFAPEQPASTRVASLETGDTRYSVDTDRVSLNLVYSGSSTALSPAAGWESASAENLRPTPSAPGTAVPAYTLGSASGVNGVYWRTDLTSTDRAYNWQLVRFDVPANLLTNANSLQLQWTGHGEPTNGYPVKAYLWDFQASQWVQAFTAQGGTDFTLAHSERQAGNETFCLSCHRATPPAGASGAAAFVNITSSWDADYHGDGVGAGNGLATLKVPYVRGNPSLTCDTCHDSHGSGNVYHLKPTINGTSGIAVSNGVEFQNACRACHEGTVASFHQQCYGCHYGEHGWGPEINETYDCSACHQHGKVWVHNDDGCHCGELPSARSF